MSEEDKTFFEKFILNNPFDFKQGIINHCRTIDKLDVYEWVAEDELKINKLQQENKKYKEVIDKARECIKNFLCTEEYINVNGIAIADNYAEVLDMLKEVSDENNMGK